MIEFNTTYAVFVSNDLAALSAFYTATFGFDAVFFEPDFYLHLKHPVNGMEIGFLAPGLDNQPDFLGPVADRDGYVLTFEVADARVALERAEAMGLDIAMAFREEAWGQRHFMVRDPAGVVLDIVEHFGPEG